MKLRELPAVRLSPRVTLQPRDSFRASGGPIHRRDDGPHRIGHPGLYRVCRIYARGDRIFVDAVKLGDRGLCCGMYTLFVSGKPFRSRLAESIVNRPYRIRKVRR